MWDWWASPKDKLKNIRAIIFLIKITGFFNKFIKDYCTGKFISYSFNFLVYVWNWKLCFDKFILDFFFSRHPLEFGGLCADKSIFTFFSVLAYSILEITIYLRGCLCIKNIKGNFDNIILVIISSLIINSGNYFSKKIYSLINKK